MKSISLIGFSAVGKTTVGERLAQRLGKEFVDLDSFVEERYHSSITEMFRSCGVDKFRKREKAALIELTLRKDTVLATGGGAPMAPGNMDLLVERTTVVYLHAAPEDLARRLSLVRDSRPLVARLSDEEIKEYVMRTLPERENVYRRAHITVEATPLVTDEDADLVALRILERLSTSQ